MSEAQERHREAARRWARTSAAICVLDEKLKTIAMEQFFAALASCDARARAEQREEDARVRRALSDLVAAVERVVDWGEDTRVGNALDAAMRVLEGSTPGPDYRAEAMAWRAWYDAKQYEEPAKAALCLRAANEAAERGEG